MADETYGIFVEADVKEAHRNIDQLRRELSSISDQKIAVKTDMRSLQSQIAQFEKMKKEVDRLNSKIAKLGTKKDNIKFKLDGEIYKEIDKLQKKLEELQNGLQDKTNKLKADTGLLEGVNKDIERFRELNDLIQKTSATLEKVKSQGNKGLTTVYENKLGKQMTEQRSLGSEGELQDRKRSIQKDIAQDEKDINKYGDKISNIESKLDKASVKAKTYENNLKAVNEEQNKLTNKRDELVVELKNYPTVKEQLEDLTDRYKWLTNKKLDIDMRINGIKEFLGELKQVYDETNLVGKSLKNIGSSMISFGSNMQELGKGMQMIFSDNGNSPFGRLVYNITQGTLFSALYRSTASAMNMISESVSGAVERYDQLNVSINTLHNLGIATKDVKEAQDDLTNSIEGLPTQMNDALSAVTKFTSINHDVKRSAKLFEAMNNGILAFGGTSEQVQNAITQYSQIMGSKMDARTLRSFEDAGFTPVLTAIAKKMGMSFSDFRNNFTGTNPTISLQQFEDALIDLNENGGGGINASLQDLAKQSTQTITNAIKLIKTRLIRGGSDIISSLNDMVQDFTGKSIYENIDTFTTNLYKKMQDIAKYIKSHKDEIKDSLMEVKDYFTDYFKDIFGDVDIKKLLKVGLDSLVSMGKMYLEVAKVYMKAYKSLFTLIGHGDWEKGLATFVKYKVIMGSILQIVGKIIIVSGRGVKMMGSIIGLVEKMQFAIKAYRLIKGDKSSGFFGGIVKGLESIGKRIPILNRLTKYMQTYRKVSSSGKEGKTVAERNASGEVEGMPPVPRTFDMTGFKEMLSKHLDRSLTIAEVAAVGGVVLEWAKVLKAVNKEVPDDIGSLAKKLATMAGAVTAIGAFNTAIGALSNLKIGKLGVTVQKASIIGMAEMAGEGGALWLLAKGIGELCEAIPDDFGSGKLTKKLASLGWAIAVFSSYAGVLGGITLLTGGTAGIAVAIGSLLTALEGISLKSLGDGISKLAGIPEALSKLPDEGKYKGLEKKFLALKNFTNKIQSEFGGNFISNIADTFKNWSQSWKESSLAGAVENLASVADSVNKIVDIKIPTSDKGISKLETKFKSISGIMEWISKSKTFKWMSGDKNKEKSIEDMHPGWGTKKSTNASDFNKSANTLKNNIANYATILTSLGNTAESLSKIKKFDVNTGTIKSYVKQLKQILKELSDLDLTKVKGFSGDKINKIAGAFEGIPNLYDKIRVFSDYMANPDNLINKDDLETKVRGLAEILGVIKKNLSGKFKNMPTAEKVKSLTDAVEQLPVLLDKINDFNSAWNTLSQRDFEPTGKNSMVTNIKSSIKGMNQILGAFTEKESGDKGKDNTSLSARIKKIGGMADQFNALPAVMDSLLNAFTKVNDFETKWTEISKIFTNNGGNIQSDIETALTGFRSILGAFDDNAYDIDNPITDKNGKTVGFKQEKGSNILAITKKIGAQVQQFQNLVTVIDSMLSVATKLQDLNNQLATINGSNINSNIITFRNEILSLFAPDNDKDTVDLGSLTKKINKVDYAGLLEQIQKFSSIAQAIIDIPMVEKDVNVTNIQNISAVVDEMKKLAGKKFDVSGLSKITAAIQVLQTDLLSITESTYTSVGSEMADKIVEGFNSVDMAGQIQATVTNVAKSIKTGAFKSKGTSAGNKFMSGLKGALKNVDASSIASSLSRSGGFHDAGVTLGNQLIAGIKEATSNANITVHVTASTKKSSGGEVFSKAGNIASNAVRDVVNKVFGKSSGGQVAYKSNGGMLAYFEPKGTDTVPAMLTPGEFVIRKRAVDKFGVDFLEKLNKGDLNGALQSIMTTQKSLNNYTKNVNINNSNTVNNYDNRSISIDNQRGTASARLKAGRWMRAI